MVKDREVVVEVRDKPKRKERGRQTSVTKLRGKDEDGKPLTDIGLLIPLTSREIKQREKSSWRQNAIDNRTQVFVNKVHKTTCKINKWYLLIQVPNSDIIPTISKNSESLDK